MMWRCMWIDSAKQMVGNESHSLLLLTKPRVSPVFSFDILRNAWIQSNNINVNVRIKMKKRECVNPRALFIGLATAEHDTVFSCVNKFKIHLNPDVRVLGDAESCVPGPPRETRYRDIGGCEISEVNKWRHPATGYVLIHCLIGYILIIW